jgi:hypothetical protein
VRGKRGTRTKNSSGREVDFASNLATFCMQLRLFLRYSDAL